jgi:hypothetical protein
MKKVFFLIAFLFVTAVNTAVVYVAVSDEYETVQMPLGDGEEENKDVSEEDDDDVVIDHRWLSHDQSTASDLHFLYQETLFNDLEIEVVVPPPKG